MKNFTPIWSKPERWLTTAPGLILCMVFLQACGGGTPHDAQAGQATPPVSKTISLALDASLPPAVAGAIDKLVSPLGSGTLAAGVEVPLPAAAPGGDSVIFAVDAHNDIVLASLTSGGAVVFSADSSALALVRMAFGAVPAGLTADQLNQTLRSAPAYADLVALVKQTLADGAPPSTSPYVVHGISQVIAQAAPGLSTLLASPAGQGSTLLAAVTTADPVTLPLPYKALPDTGILPSVYIVDGGVTMVNSMLITWSAHTSAVPTETLLAGSSVKTILLGRLTPWLGPDRIVVPDGLAVNEGQGVDMVLEQTSASHRANLSAIQRGLASQLIGLLLAGASPLSGQCQLVVGNALISSDKLDALAAQPSSEAFQSYLADLSMSPLQINDVANACLADAAAAAKAAAGMGGYAKVIARFISGFRTAMAITDALSLGAMVATTGVYWDRRVALRVCQAAGIFSKNVVNCASAIKVTPDVVRMALGAEKTMQIEGFASLGTATPLPTNLAFSSSVPGVAVLDAKSWKLTAYALGTTSIKVSDPFTGAGTSFTVSVVAPRISPAVLRLKIGESANLLLVDDAGNPVIHDGSGTVWATSDAAIAELNIILSATCAPNCLSILGRAPGHAVISAGNPHAKAPLTADVFVLPDIVILPAAPTLRIGDTLRLTASFMGSGGNAIATPPGLLWSSSDIAVATVDADSAIVTANAAGTAVITVSDPGSTASASTTISVAAAVPPNKALISSWSCAALGNGRYAVELKGWANAAVPVGADTILSIFGESENSTADADSTTDCSAWSGHIANSNGGRYCRKLPADMPETAVRSHNLSTQAGPQLAWFIMNYYDPVLKPTGGVLFETEIPISCPGSGIPAKN